MKICPFFANVQTVIIQNSDFGIIRTFLKPCPYLSTQGDLGANKGLVAILFLQVLYLEKDTPRPN